LIFFVFVGGIIASIAVPSFQKARLKAQQRACFANQKTIAAATEMYNLDFNTRVDKLNPAFFQILLKKGYFKRLPECPASRKNGTNYSINSSSEITCKVHGSVSSSRYQVEK
jgi:Tfp pilus assembly protein PilE